SSPSGSWVTLDDEPIGRTPLLVLWKKGAHELSVAKAGYRAFTGTAPIAAGRIERMSVALEVLPKEENVIEEPAALKRSTKDPWKIARALLEAKKCAKLDRLIDDLVDRSTNDVDKARAKMLGAECHLRSGAKPRALELYTEIYGSYGATQSAEVALFEAAKL